MAFTLIELLVVITIIGILLSVATVSWTNAQEKSRDSKRKSGLKSVQQALELYFQDNGTYPPSNGGKIVCPNPPTPTDIVWGGNFTCTAPTAATYINPLPKDPRGGTTGTTPIITHDYYYTTGAATPTGEFLTYILSAGLENDNDAENCTDGAACVTNGELPCVPPSDKNYCVQQP